jgi:hypothetical protein
MSSRIRKARSGLTLRPPPAGHLPTPIGRNPKVPQGSWIFAGLIGENHHFPLPARNDRFGAVGEPESASCPVGSLEPPPGVDAHRVLRRGGYFRTPQEDHGCTIPTPNRPAMEEPH